MITITLDASQISTYLTCPQKWNYSGRQSLSLAGENTIYLDRGTIIHKLLELYYIERFKSEPYVAGQEAIEKFATLKEAKLVEKKDLEALYQRFRQYVFHWHHFDFEPRRLEGIPSIELGFSHLFYEDADRRYILEGKIDLFSTQHDELIFVDHKSQGRRMENYGSTVQFLNYGMVSGARRAVINYVRLAEKIDSNTFVRQTVLLPEHMILKFKRKVMSIFDEIHKHIKYLPEGADFNFPEIMWNPKSCAGEFNSRPCIFTQLCELDPMNHEMKANLKSFKYQKRVWSPWDVEEV